MKWVFSAFVVLWSLRAIENPAAADLWPNDVFTKITPRKVAKWRLSHPIGRRRLAETLQELQSSPANRGSAERASLLFLHGGPGDATNPWGYAGFRLWLRHVPIEGGGHFAVFLKSQAFLDQLVSRVLPLTAR